MAHMPKLDEIARKIYAKLCEFEHLPKTIGGEKYYQPNAWVAGSKVGIRYVSFQSDHFLSKADALAYLQWLNTGNVGKHWKWQESRKQVTDASK